MPVDVHIVHAFTDGDSGGNPAGVVLDADRLGPGQKLAIARQVGVSETAFVSASVSATVRLDFFTPTRQIAHCGHATIATFSLLRQFGMVADGLLSKETIDGNRAIRVKDGAVFMEQRAPQYKAVTPSAQRSVLQSLGIDAAAVAENLAPVIVTTGNAFLIVPLTSENALRRLAPNFAAIDRFSAAHDLIGYYVYSRTSGDGRDATARMFAPRFGINEESATGMAAGPLAGFLYDKAGITKKRLLIEQGRLMEPSSPSLLTAELDIKDGTISGLMVGGKARRVRSVSLDI